MTETKYVRELSNIEIAMLFDYITNNLGNSEIQDIITEIFEDFDLDFEIFNELSYSKYNMSILKYAYLRDYIEKITKIENDNMVTATSKTIVNNGTKYTFETIATFIDDNVNIQLVSKDLDELLENTTHITIDLYENNQRKNIIFDGNLENFLNTEFSENKFENEAVNTLYNKFVRNVYGLINICIQNIKNVIYEFEDLANKYNSIYSNLLDEDSSDFVNWFKKKFPNNVVVFDDYGNVIEYDS